MTGRQRPVVDAQARVIVRAFELPWYVDAASGNVRVCVEHDAPDLLAFLRRKNFVAGHVFDNNAQALSAVRADDAADYITYVKQDGLVRDGEQSFIEILHPELNRFIKEEILGIGTQLPVRGR